MSEEASGFYIFSEKTFKLKTLITLLITKLQKFVKMQKIIKSIDLKTDFHLIM